MFCTSCGAATEPGAHFCGACGAALTPTATPTPAAVAPGETATAWRRVSDALGALFALALASLATSLLIELLDRATTSDEPADPARLVGAFAGLVFSWATLAFVRRAADALPPESSARGLLAGTVTLATLAFLVGAAAFLLTALGSALDAASGSSDADGLTGFGHLVAGFGGLAALAAQVTLALGIARVGRDAGRPELRGLANVAIALIAAAMVLMLLFVVASVAQSLGAAIAFGVLTLVAAVASLVAYLQLLHRGGRLALERAVFVEASSQPVAR
ncbi:MAG: zinc ribbon domain-containing protein [Deltaproteobacteria bacterium]|nr:zinc ribbon domain-containing protein [Deltaproteobacteria bacterium]